MSRTFNLKAAAVASFVLTLIACSSKPKTGDSGDASAAAAPKTEFHMQAYEEQKLDNGMKILWVKDAKVPVLSMSLAIRAGGSYDPEGREGLAEMTAQLLDKGIPGKGAMAVADSLEQRADWFGASVDADVTFASIRGLSFHSRESLKEFCQLVIHPTFPKDELERERKNMLANYKRLADRPGDFANVVYGRVIYGEHPYAHDGGGTPAGVARITRDDIAKFHKHYYSPDRTTLAVVGQFDDEFKQAVVDLFSQWKKPGAVAEVNIPEPQGTPGFLIHEVQKPELQQTEIRMGHLGVKRNIPDHLALKVATAILGDPSSFQARLWNEIRVKRGLTYGVRASFDQRLEPGPFVISTFTRNDKIHEMVDQLLKVFKDFREKGVTNAEVDAAKAQLAGRFPRLVETGDDLAHQLLILDINGVPFEYLRTFQTEITKITTEQVNAAIRQHFQPENLKFVVFGPEGSKGMESLKDFGPVTIENYKKALEM